MFTHAAISEASLTMFVKANGVMSIESICDIGTLALVI
jgi:hypothetical protein